MTHPHIRKCALAALSLCVWLLALPLLAQPEAWYEEEEEEGWGEVEQYLGPQYEETAVAPRDFDRSHWKEVVKGLDYTDHSRKRKKKEEAFTPISNKPLLDMDAMASFFKILFYGGMAVLGVALVIYLAGYKPPPRNRTLKPANLQNGPVDMAQIEEDMLDTDLAPYLRQAVAEGQYTLAVRLHYLLVLQTLARSGHIRWKKDRTNREYLRDMQAHPRSTTFRHLTRTFEQVWYGNRPMGPAEFALAEAEFQHFLTSNPNNDAQPK